MKSSSEQKILILDFGGQYSRLIARRVRECSVYSEVMPFSVPLDKIKAFRPSGIIFSGGPASVYADNPLKKTLMLEKIEGRRRRG